MHCFSPGETNIIHIISFESIIGLRVYEQGLLLIAIVCSHRKIGKNILSFLASSIFFLQNISKMESQRNDIKTVKKIINRPLHLFYICYCYCFLSSP